MTELTCDVCGKESAVGVASVPFVPISVAYGRACLEADAHPYGIVVTNTACIGGYEHAVEDWQDMVNNTLQHLGISRQKFDEDVEQAIAELASPDY